MYACVSNIEIANEVGERTRKKIWILKDSNPRLSIAALLPNSGCLELDAYAYFRGFPLFTPRSATLSWVLLSLGIFSSRSSQERLTNWTKDPLS